ncbi:phage tail tape measure protein [Streptomyces sp. NPDC053705]|uniref:phage tail tape measure protein n=1 Tax=Streptomyces sp. NPDC053705 TaxID=3156668 RepID=UPI0034133D8B
MATLEELLVAIGIDTEELTTGAQGAADDVGASLGGIGALGAGAAVGGLFAMGLANAMDASAANTKLKNQLGLSEQEAARAGDVAGEVFSAGFGESIGGVNEGIQAVVSSVGGMSELTDAELQSMTTSALMLAETFELDVADAAQAAGAMINNGLVKDGAEAFDVLTVAAQNLPKQMLADIPATVNEYGKHWSRIGLDAQTAMGMMSQYVQAGGRDIDQAGDVLHEFARITSEETDKASAAFKGLGLNSKDMLADIHKGGEPAKAALQKTIEALRGVKDEGKQSALAVELFGDMAGEGADALWAMDPATAATSNGMKDVKGAAAEANAAMAASPAQSMESIMRTLATTIGETLAPALVTVSNFLKEHPGLIKILVPIVLALAVAMGIFAVVTWAVNAALLANPITWIILGIIALIAVIILVIVYWDEIVAATKRTWDQIVAVLGWAWGWITAKASEAWGWVSQKTSEAWTWVQQKVADAIAAVMQRVQTLASIPGKVSAWFGQVVSWIGGLPGKIRSAASGMWDGISSSFRSMVNQLISGWNSLSFTIGGGSIMGVSIPSLTLSTPNIPMLAEGGVTTGPTLAMIGEGAEQETVLPLSKLDGMLRSVAGSVRDTGGGGRGEIRVTIDATGGNSALRTALQEIVRIEARGDVQEAFGQ